MWVPYATDKQMSLKCGAEHWRVLCCENVTLVNEPRPIICWLEFNKFFRLIHFDYQFKIHEKKSSTVTSFILKRNILDRSKFNFEHARQKNKFTIDDSQYVCVA